jgi:hypothetical protein
MLFIASLSFVVTSSALAQTNEADVTSLRNAFATAATNFQIVGGPDGNTKLILLAEPILNWSNPERRTAAGGLFLWTLDGRPQVAMCAYPTEGDAFDNEFQSLSLWPMTVRREGNVVWAPSEAGLVMRPLDDPQLPFDTASRRLLQMRNLAREFEAKLVPPKRPEIPLRLLTSPIYRYPQPESESVYVDGAIFAFVQGTDPEVLLILEATKNAQGGLEWQYAVARMSIVPTELTHRKELTWETEWAITNPSTPYFVVKDSP